MKKLSQKQRILSYLKKGKTLTPLGALNMFKCFRLASRVYELRADGYDIKKSTTLARGKRYASYKLVD